MALFPVYGRFIGDFVPHLVPADTDDNMDELAEKIAVHSVGRRVPVEARRERLRRPGERRGRRPDEDPR